VWRGQQATSRGAMWEGRGSLVYPHTGLYRPSCHTENAAGAVLAPRGRNVCLG
jgi:hypothetical protein